MVDGSSLLRPRGHITFAEEQFRMFVLDEAAAEYEQRHDDVIRLTLGKSELPPEPLVVEAMVAAARDYRCASRVHPAGLPELRERLAEEYRHRYGVDLPPSRFVVGTGTSGLLRNLMQLLIESGDEVVLPLPYYPLHSFAARLCGATVRHYRIDTATMRADLDSLRRAITERTRMVVVNSPGNPLGNVIDADEFRRFDEVVAGRAILISDEMYGNVLFDDEPYSALQLVDELRCPLVVTDGFSKGHRMYARRVGYAVVPEPLIEPLAVVQHHTLLTTDPVSQFGAIAALDNPAGVARLTELYRHRRDLTLHRLAAIPGVRPLPSRGGFYLTLDCAGYLGRLGEDDSMPLARRILDRVRVATVPGADFGLPLTLRLSFSAERYEEAVDRLAGFFTAG